MIQKNLEVYYHISKKDLGVTKTFTPKIPTSSVISSEGNIPRISVCLDIYNCARAIVGHRAPSLFDFLSEFENDGYYDSPVIYAVNGYPYLPPNASDFKRNKEHWFLKRTLFDRIGYIDLVNLINNRKLSIIEEPIKVKKIETSELLQKILKTK